MRAAASYKTVVVTTHAAARWAERVDPRGTHADVREAFGKARAFLPAGGQAGLYRSGDVLFVVEATGPGGKAARIVTVYKAAA